MLISVGFVSCSKDDNSVVETSEQKIPQGIEKIILKSDKKTNVGTYEMLSFPSWESFEDKVVQLDSLVSDYETDFYNQHANLTEEEFNIYADSVGFNEEVPLIDFENAMNITNSLRVKYNAERAVFFSNSVLDDSKDPSLKYLFDDAEMSLLNERQEIMVAGDVYRFSADGYIIISDDHYNTLVRIDNNDPTVLNEPYVTVYNESQKAAGSCTKWKTSNNVHYYSQGKRMNRITTIRAIGSYYCKTKAKMESQWLISSGWKPKSRLMQVGVQANLFDGNNCSTVVKNDWSGMKKKNATKLKKTMTTWGNNMAAQKNVSVQGTYMYGGLTTYYSLTW